jgi:hypothetical protein
MNRPFFDHIQTAAYDIAHPQHIVTPTGHPVITLLIEHRLAPELSTTTGDMTRAVRITLLPDTNTSTESRNSIRR